MVGVVGLVKGRGRGKGKGKGKGRGFCIGFIVIVNIVIVIVNIVIVHVIFIPIIVIIAIFSLGLVNKDINTMMFLIVLEYLVLGQQSTLCTCQQLLLQSLYYLIDRQLLTIINIDVTALY